VRPASTAPRLVSPQHKAASTVGPTYVGTVPPSSLPVAPSSVVMEFFALCPPLSSPGAARGKRRPRWNGTAAEVESPSAQRVLPEGTTRSCGEEEEQGISIGGEARGRKHHIDMSARSPCAWCTWWPITTAAEVTVPYAIPISGVLVSHRISMPYSGPPAKPKHICACETICCSLPRASSSPLG